MASLSPKDRVSLCLFSYEDGRRCRTPRTGSHPHFCFYHAQKESQSQTAEKLAKDLTYFFSGDYLSANDLNTALGRLIPAVVRGEIKPRLARTVAYMFQTLMQSTRLAQHEYINAFGTDGWRDAVYTSVTSNHDHLYPPDPNAPEPETNSDDAEPEDEIEDEFEDELPKPTPTTCTPRLPRPPLNMPRQRLRGRACPAAHSIHRPAQPPPQSQPSAAATSAPPAATPPILHQPAPPPKPKPHSKSPAPSFPTAPTQPNLNPPPPPRIPLQPKPTNPTPPHQTLHCRRNPDADRASQSAKITPSTSITPIASWSTANPGNSSAEP